MSDDSTNAVRAALETIGVSYEIVPCDPALADTAVFCEHYDIPAANSANTIVVSGRRREDRRFAACVLLSNTRLDVNKTVRKRLDVRRISFATPEETRVLTGMDLGGVTPLALPTHLPLWIDRAVMRAEYIILGGGDRASKVKVSPSVFEHLPGAEFVDGLATPIA